MKLEVTKVYLETRNEERHVQEKLGDSEDRMANGNRRDNAIKNREKKKITHLFLFLV